MGGESGVSRSKLLRLEWVGDESCSAAQGTTSNPLQWDMMEDNVRKRMYMFNWVTLQQKLTEHYKSTKGKTSETNR